MYESTWSEGVKHSYVSWRKRVENNGNNKDMETKRQDIRTLSKRHPKLET